MTTVATRDVGLIDATSAAATAPRRRVSRLFGLWVPLAVLLLIVLACMCAPLYARYIAHTTVNADNLAGSVRIHGHETPVVSNSSSSIGRNGQLHLTAGGSPIGPQWLAAGGRYVLGADEEGRDVAVRLLYGGRLSLEIGFVATTICISISVLLALLAGYLGGLVDAVIGRVLDVIWSFPWLLLSVAIGSSVALGGFDLLGIHIGSGSFILVTTMLTYGPIPYYARALRSVVLTLGDADFVRAARLAGARAPRILIGELLPNITTMLPAMYALNFANVLLAESALTYLGVGVQPPTASWGSMIAEGQTQLYTAPWLTLFPSLAIAVTAICLNVLGERFRSRSPRRSKSGRRDASSAVS